MAPSVDHNSLVEHIKSIRAALHLASDPDTRNALLEELGAATQQLVELVLRKDGTIRSPLE